MGAAISAARREAERADEESKQRIKEQLDFLVNVANNKLDQYQNEIEELVPIHVNAQSRHCTYSPL
jgi:hypothetical protein